MSDYTVIWDGRGRIPGMSAEGWSYQGNYLLDMAPGHGNWIQPRDPGLKNAPPAVSFNHKPGRGRPPGKTLSKCGCGRVKTKRARICVRCVTCQRGSLRRRKAA